MILISYYYFIINILFYFISFTLTKNSCQKKSYGLNSFVCVCSSKYCDSPLPLGELNNNQLIYYISDKSKYRLERFSVLKNNIKEKEEKLNLPSIGYNIGRVPIASCDFSTHEYSYLDIPNNFSLNNFKLAPEDYELKIPHILTAINITKGNLKLLATPWSAPGWMKTSGRMKGPGQLKGPFNGIYYRTYANYLKKFFEEYSIKNINFWGMTIENEPDLQKIDSIDGLATHWYSRSDYEILNQAHNFQPNKFIISTEACNGYLPWEHKPLLGDWFRGQAYGHDILNNLKNWVIGWIDWNLCLNLQGGPNWVGNFVDSPIIVNASADEFYKQPMFYFLAHFSHFIPRNSLVISSSLFIKKCKNELFKCILNSININLIENQIEHLALITPNGNRILIILNKSQENFDVIVKENNRSWNIPIKSNSIITCIWKENE